ncbi:hypothetical protein BX661DRAFT_177374 [Kickxella alabastrina]|uniref:uncharacterized protein n=1 Tax=Kickxella alabastrina TaxID=61397 RepID=UPI00221FF043|nr:uncharacterized protein BX661DRAFT_177374 [Kickxella alabastrina]KAI7833697.1 hypothetical protein BX661DRAFT_177374 [Kickxella alabastrina]
MSYNYQQGTGQQGPPPGNYTQQGAGPKPNMGPGGFAPPPNSGPHMNPNPYQQQHQQQQQQQRPGGYANAPTPYSQDQPKVHWVAASDNHIPPQAVQGGVEKDGTPLFVARARYRGGLHPGKAGQHIQDGGCAIGWGHKEVNLGNMRFCAKDELVVQGFRPVEAGHEETGEPLFIAKSLYEGSQQLGKCAPHIKKGMSFPYGHKERTTDEYKVLAYV